MLKSIFPELWRNKLLNRSISLKFAQIRLIRSSNFQKNLKCRESLNWTPPVKTPTRYAPSITSHNGRSSLPIALLSLLSSLDAHRTAASPFKTLTSLFSSHRTAALLSLFSPDRPSLRPHQTRSLRRLRFLS